jgi:hypothetical protein
MLHLDILNSSIGVKPHNASAAILAETLNMPALAYYPVASPRYALQWVTVFLFIGIFAGALGSLVSGAGIFARPGRLLPCCRETRL